MHRFRSIVAVVAVLVCALQVHAVSNSADASHVHVQLVTPQDQLYPGGDNHIGLFFKLESGWHVYWQNAGDSGEPPRIQWTLPEGVTAGAMQFPPPKRLPLGPLMDFGYEDQVLFPIPLQVADTVKDGPAALDAKVNWLVCREVCIPGKAELEVKLHVLPGKPAVVSGSGSDQELFQHWQSLVPGPLPATSSAVFQPTSTGFRLAINTGKRETQAAFFPADQDVLNNPALQKVTPTATGAVLELQKDPNGGAGPGQLKGVIELAGGRNYAIEAAAGAVAAPQIAPSFSVAALASTAFFAFLGGILLNLMPCVFPVLFLKGLALVNSGSEERHKLRAHGLVYAAGILVSFWALVAVLLALRAAGGTFGWGFQFQSPVFLLLIAGLLFFLGLSLAGQFEIGLTLTSTGGSLANKQGYAGSFFTGVLAVVVATPCAAPFMGTAIGYALAQPAAVTFAIFTALALGLAAPYVALTLQPAWTRLLPKPGAWMDIFKQFTSLFLFGFVIWLAWVVAQAYGAALLAALLSIFLLLAVAGWFLGRWPAQRWATAVAGVVLLIAVGAAVAAPKQLAEAPATESAQNVSKDLPPRSGWKPWSADGVQQALAAGQPVLVDFTASWCLSCQVNERVALSRPEVQQALAGANIALFRADWTREDPAITEALTALGRSGVPVYALYTPGASDPELLPQVLTPGIVIDAINKIPRAAAAR